MKFPFFMGGWNMRPTCDMMLSTVFTSDAPWNESGYKSEIFDKLLLEAKGELDERKRQELYCEAQRMIRDDGGVIVPAFYDYIDAISDKIKGFEPCPLANLGGLKFHETIWIDS